MIITKLMGGLGNQMFQFAVAKALAAKHGVEAKVDLSFLQKDTGGVYTQRAFELTCFTNDIKTATPEELAPYTKRAHGGLPFALQSILPFFFKGVYAKENGNRFQRQILELPKEAYLDGFWQSELYFKDQEKTIRECFTFSDAIRNTHKEMADQMRSKLSVSLHVRRGDYVSNALANKFHGLCSPNYYQNAVKHLMALGNIEVYIFSDDLDWCRQHSKFEVPMHYVNTNDAYADMYLMSQCKHHVIANSSFSWWGAWLNADPDKVVIAPKTWFNDPSIDTSDVIPTTWQKM